MLLFYSATSSLLDAVVCDQKELLSLMLLNKLTSDYFSECRKKSISKKSISLF